MFRRQALITLAALGLAMGSGTALSAPVGLQGLPSNPLIGERGATAEPAHYTGRRHVHVQRRYVHPRRYGRVHPRSFRHRHVAPRHRYSRRGYLVPRHRFVPRHRYGYRHHYRSRPSVSFGFSFGR